MWVRLVIRDEAPPSAGRSFSARGGRILEDGADLGWSQETPPPQRRFTRTVLVPADDVQAKVQQFIDEGFSVHADPLIAAADVWTSYAPGGGLFGTREKALRLIGADPRPDPRTGEGVNVVIFDYGIEWPWLQAERRRHGLASDETRRGWPRYRVRSGAPREWSLPGDRPPAGLTHAQMIARNILAIAPAVTIWDAPLLPDVATGPPSVALAEAIFWHVFDDWERGRQEWRGAPASWVSQAMPKHQPWILVNAWGVLDPARHDPFFGRPIVLEPNETRRRERYWDNPGHYFIEDMGRLSDNGIDVVFAAGNCGAPGAHPLCGDSMVGPGRSIHGVNAHPGVLTVGAVRADGVPIGGSGQGPGALIHYVPEIPALPRADLDSYRMKPDLCAPSQFHETEGDGLVNTGTSAACGIAAGVLAALRGMEVAAGKSQLDSRRTPEQMRGLLRETARPGGSWDPRLGWGVIDVKRARDKL